MSLRSTALITLVAVASIAAQRAGLFARLGRATTVRTVRPGAR